ncbi:poly polymerase catalytic domain-containing protein [Mycena leptocephala]|nr:poly polymerase catalytic domain-containing protein [Mycena leptocephala]
MPPRKKAADADGAAPAPTRSSTRTKTAPAAAPAATTSKPKSKRARAASDDEDDEDDAPLPKSPPAKRPKRLLPAKRLPPLMMTTPMPTRQLKWPRSTHTQTKFVSIYFSGDELSLNTLFRYAPVLNQTNIDGGNNNNKFYVLQLLHPIGNDAQCLLFTRWGRVGVPGSTQVKVLAASVRKLYMLTGSRAPGPAMAVNEFKKQFKAKAAVNWENRVGMVQKSGKYTWLERDYGDEDEDDDKATGGSDKKKNNAPIPPSILAPELQDFCSLIFLLRTNRSPYLHSQLLTFHASIINETLSSMNYDANKLPLGKLAKSTILKGFAALKVDGIFLNLAEVIDKPNGETAKENGGFATACSTLSSAYYSIIPHDFGMRRPTNINTQDLLKRYLTFYLPSIALSDTLLHQEIASKLIAANQHEDENGNPVNPSTRTSAPWACRAWSPSSAPQMSSVSSRYVRDTHGHTHGHIKANVLNAFRVERAGETAAWEKGGFDKMADGERLLLWHGSRSTNFAGILKQGLRIAPPEGEYMFGKGVYFADMMSKSAGYCYSHLSHDTGLLLLCEVAAKPFYELTNAEYNADKGCKANKAKATKGLGRTQPGKWKDAGKALGNDELLGCHMPDGPGQDAQAGNGIRLKYLLMVKMR